MTEFSEKIRTSPLRRAMQVALALATVIALAGCGAVISTTMTVANDGSGTRVIVATLTGANMAKLTNGSTGVDSSIRKHLPAELTYSGITPQPDGGASVTLILLFASAAEYTQKAESLLAKGGDTSRKVDFSVSESVLLNGIVLNEDFSSYGLLKWMFDGLLHDGVVPQSEASNMYEIGTTVLNYGGASIGQSGSYDYSGIVDNGFSSVSMATDIADSDKITRTISYAADPSKYAAHEALFNQYFAQATPTGSELTSISDGSWKLTFHGDAKTVSRYTDQALGSTGTTLSIDSGTVVDDPATLTKTVTDRASFTNIRAGGGAVRDTLSVGAGWSPHELEVDASATTPISFHLTPTISSVDADFRVGIFGAVTATVKFVVPNKGADLVGDGFTRLFRPAKDVGTVTSKKGADATTFTTVITAGDAATFASAYAKWAPGSSFSAVDGRDSTFVDRNVNYEIDPELSVIVKGHKITGATTISIGLPFGQQMSSATGTPRVDSGIVGTTVTYLGKDAAPSFRSSGLTFAGLLLIGGMVLALVVVALLLVRYRRQVLPRLRAARGRTSEALHAGRVRFNEGLQPTALESRSIEQALPASRAQPGSTLLGLRTARATAVPSTSMLDWPERKGSAPSAVPMSSLHPTVMRLKGWRPTSLFSLPTTRAVRMSRESLVGQADLFS